MQLYVTLNGHIITFKHTEKIRTSSKNNHFLLPTLPFWRGHLHPFNYYYAISLSFKELNCQIRKMCSSKKLFGGLAAGWQAVCNPLSGKLACRMTVDLSIIDTGKSDKPNASEIGNWEKKFWCLQKAIFLKVVCWPVVFCFLFFQIFIEQILAFILHFSNVWKLPLPLFSLF